MFETISKSALASVGLWLSLLISSVAQSAEPEAALTSQSMQEQLVDVGGHRLLLKTLRSADRVPLTIVLESGGGFDSGQWRELQPRLAAETRANVVSYDRAGFGQSDLPDTPYDIVAEVQSLRTALQELRLEDRLILVGHSFGGLLSQLYTNRYPDSVKGVLFLDPSSPAAMLAIGGAAVLPQPKPNPATKKERAFARIDAAGIEPYVAVYRSPLPANIPVVVLTAEKGLFPNPRQNRAFRVSHELLAASVEDGEWAISQSGHNIPGQRPDLVVASVKRLIAKAVE